MQHRIELDQLRPVVGPQIDDMADAIGRCVHCGFCLATCPTYALMGEEMDSPRGRIFLMKEVLEDRLELDEVLEHIDPCLGCMACVTSCPSGVEYGDLLVPFRAHAERQRRRGLFDRAWRGLLLDTLASPRRFRWMARLGSLARPLRSMLPQRLAAPLDLLPDRLPPRQELPRTTSAHGSPRARVAMIEGCAQTVLAPEINQATLAVLSHNGVEVTIPEGQGCCGALALHSGDERRSLGHARSLLRAVQPHLDNVDAVITNAAGCGSGIGDYGLLFKGRPEHEHACRLTKKLSDVSTFLASLGLRAPGSGAELNVAYQDPCHLAHAQRECEAPRRLLEAIPGVRLVESENAEICCGSAGTYNLEHPEAAAELGARKAADLAATGASIIVTGNIGCLRQVDHHLAAGNARLPVLHTMQVLAAAYAGTLADLV